ncbi:MAG: right-handed parallel beta-helix repeat-containing protein, partial [Methanothrix sp.]
MSTIMQPAAFFSYSHHDDNHDHGYLTKLRDRLSGEVRSHHAKEFPIFQDRNSIEWGQNWIERITESLRGVTFLIPIITPNYFASEACLDELRQFAEYGKNVNRNDLILPIYYIRCEQMETNTTPDDELVNLIKDHQYKDWRDLRGKSLKLVKFNERLEELALDITNAIDRLQKSDETILDSSSDISGQLDERFAKDEKLIEKKYTQTLIVDKNQNKCFKNINDAIKASNMGDKIVIRPGIYDESIIINKNLEIVGEGDSNNIVVRAAERSVLASVASHGCVKNISLKQVSGNWFCVDIPFGSIVIENCEITSQESPCVGIHHGANPLLKHNSIHGSAQCGVFIFDNARGILEDNDIFDNSFSGIEIKNFANPILRLNRIRDGKQGGILVHKDGLGIFENNEIFKNIAGIEIRDGGNPNIRYNKIYNNKESGIIVTNYGLGILEHNDISDNGHDGVGIRSNGNPILRHNSIRDGKQGGIFVLDGGFGVLENNDIFGNESDAVAIKSQGNPKLRHNRIYRGKSDGIYIWDNGLGVIEDNDIFGNVHGIEVEKNSNPILQRNMIHDNKQFGVRIQDSGRGILEANEI